MRSERYSHEVAAVYPDAAAAEAAVRSLGGADPDEILVVKLAPGTAGDVYPGIEPEPQTTRGTMAGDSATGATAMPAPTLFVSAPVVGPLIVLGYGAAIAGVAGAVRAHTVSRELLAGLVEDALKAGYHVVIVRAADEAAQRRVRDAINETMAEDAAHPT